MNSEIAAIVEPLALDLWHRFRLLATVVEKGESFVSLAPAPASPERAPSSPAGSQPTAKLLADEGELRNMARTFILRALQTALESRNAGILQQAERSGAPTAAELRPVVDLDPVAMHEHINDLVQVGLVTKDFESGRVQTTPGGAAVNRLLELLEGEFVRLASRGR